MHSATGNNKPKEIISSEPKLSGYQRFAKSYNSSTSSKELLSDVRDKFFTNYKQTEKYTYETPQNRYTSSQNQIEESNSDSKVELTTENKVSNKEKVIELVDKALKAYNSLQQNEECSSQDIIPTEEKTTTQKEYQIEHPTKNIDFQSEAISSPRQDTDDSFKFVGSALGTFIIAEQNNVLYIIDKHAAHERILYNKIIQAKGQKQELLVPYTIKTQTEEEDKYLESIQESLTEIGFTCKNCGNGNWEFSSIQERWTGSEEDLRHALLDEKVKPEEIIYSIAATAACKAAVKDGYTLDDDTARKIAKEALLLPDPHCPHGRPVYTTISREQLFALVRRT